jgi:hypothetical protein
MSGNCDDPTKRSGKAGVRTNPAKNKPVTSTSIHGRNTFGQNIPHDSDNSSDFKIITISTHLNETYSLIMVAIIFSGNLLIGTQSERKLEVLEYTCK